MSAAWRSSRSHLPVHSVPQQQQIGLPSSVVDWPDKPQRGASSQWNDYHQRLEAAEASTESNSSRSSPSRPRKTASISQRGVRSRTLPGAIHGRDGFSKDQEERQRNRWQKETVERSASNIWAPQTRSAAGGARIARVSPGRAALAMQDGKITRIQQEQQQQQQQQHVKAETSVVARSMMSGTDYNRTSPYATSSSSSPPPPPQSQIVSPQMHTRRGSHQQQRLAWTDSSKYWSAPAIEVGSPSHLSGGDGDKKRPSLTMLPNWPHATDRCDGSSRTEPGRKQQAPYEAHQSPQSMATGKTNAGVCVEGRLGTPVVFDPRAVQEP